MTEKLEQSKEFIREISILTNRNMWLNIAMEHIYKSEKSFPVLYKYIFCDGFQDSIANQLTFAKIWAGEIELVEKKPKYVIYQVNENSKTGKVHYTIYAMAEESRFYPRRVNTDRVPDINASPDELFDQDFAFAMRDTGKFKIKKVVE
ncbi:hypothetical protein KAR50_00280 [Periweissella fabaria]|uniref:Uncharacterized protein n=1 Tax=Periweissella fabaria TaxID=546157 RepID=A0ABM8Z488_9LACO|nr:hypothetical protein [Periweissella fabaria]MCM0596297.1 hypothetical protein [Periweissella fabaria]CAH0415948.1 hypothetical protein WFA24289_00246 [Periweissella fabaria]